MTAVSTSRWSVWLQSTLGRQRVLTALAVVAGVALFVGGSGYRYSPLSPADTPAAGDPDSGGRPAALAEVESVTPRGVYIVIDRANNKIYLKRGQETVLEALCSSGSGSILRDPAGNRQWVFDTPAGVFKVRSKIPNPVWRKPDWAFIEEGSPLPEDPGERIEYGMLGEYALDLGDGYLIHGTLYERLLGRSVTHGCIRVGREDLRKLYQATKPGTAVYIF